MPKYKTTVLERFFGKFLFLLVIDEDRKLLDINKNGVECSFHYMEDIGLCKI